MSAINDAFNDAFMGADEITSASVIINPSLPGAEAVIINGVFDNPGVKVLTNAGNVEAAVPCFFCKATDAAAITNNSTITISGTVYYKISAEPDGFGMTYLSLSKQKAY